jgi:LPXTG-motif cell wall-anchored protein
VTAVAKGALHHHSGPDRSEWACNANNLVEQFTVEVDTDGDYRSPGEQHGIGWYSYDNRFVVVFEDGANWRSELFGCGVEAESFEARPPNRPPATSPPPVTAPPITAPPITAPPPIVHQPPAAPPRSEPPPPTTPPRLPKTGGEDSGWVQLLAILLVLVGGSLYLFTPASALPFPRPRRFRDLCQQIRERHR